MSKPKNGDVTAKAGEAVVTERGVVEIHESPACPKHGGPVPTINIKRPGGSPDVFDVCGEWCLICVIEMYKKNGVSRCV